MILREDWIQRPETQAVFAMLEQAGHQALFVGGCVRNALLGVPVKDIDIATDATPDDVIALAERTALRAVPTGVEHGTVTVVSGDLPHEVTTFREDIATDGRHAVVRYAKDVVSDARRRDFTINALYATRLGEVIDPLSGFGDLQARKVRFIEDAARRIQEDHLRSLRFFRFHAWYGDPETGMDPDGLAAIAAHVDGVKGLSRERVGSELLRLLAAPNPAPAVAAMRQTGVLHAVLPGAQDSALAPLIHLEALFDTVPDAIRRLAALGGEDMVRALRLSRGQARELDTLQSQIGSGLTPLALGYHLGAALARSVVLLRSAVFEQHPDHEDFMAINKGAEAVCPVKAADLMHRFRGAELGRALKRIEMDWLSSGCEMTRSELLERDLG